MTNEFKKWNCSESSNNVDFLIIPENEFLPILMTCEDTLANNYQNKEQAEKNAKLAAAAPELFNVLVDLLDDLDGQAIETSTNRYIKIAENIIKNITQ